MMAMYAPSWFYGYDVIMELLFSIVSFAVAFLALRVYRRTSQRHIQHFGVAFLLIGISYLVQSVFNYLAISRARSATKLVESLSNLVFFDAAGTYLQFLFMLLGLSILVYVTFRISKIRLLWFLLGVSLATLLSTTNVPLTFYVLSSIYLGFIAWHFIQNHMRTRQTKTLLIALAFTFLFLSKIHMVVALLHQLFYAVGHFLELFAYILILANFWLVLRR